ncbi:ap-2 complex subunit sigma [Anaeramoeba ignava]|uniref:AP complex subunit sigma n=1 Tax=Anaeramoeba ignava TaxID=1746090 RepID=A0A9Q0LIH7_ANAIG|nr:ap-2 complex subunit sigma [Anaeramoeba ignava]KAJ5075148.1 ap-2 complex subunit sigma [Anaeramoeba ignava]
MIRFFLIQNRQGQTRLSRWYVPYEDEEKTKLTTEIHKLVSHREAKGLTNFAEYRTYKVIYRRYAGLYFVMCVDTTDNELSILESIHLFVEVLDSYFKDVCELDIVFNFWKCYTAMDEMFLTGEIQETSRQVIRARLDQLDKLD